jgi:hypothetical protein
MADRIALVISDIDGTLITSNHELTDATLRTAIRLQDSGIMLSLASSRPPRSIRPLALQLDLRAPFAAFNGALVVNTQGETVAESTIPLPAVQRVKSIADEFQLAVWLYDAQDWWAPWRDAFVDREEHTSGFSPKIDGYGERVKSPCTKLTVVGSPALVAKAQSRVWTELADGVSASCSKPRFLDVTAHGIHKGSVVVRISNLLHIDSRSVAVIGDGPNDIEMFKQAGTSIAMGQAVDEVRQAATNVTQSNDMEGWSLGIEEFVLNAGQPRATIGSRADAPT